MVVGAGRLPSLRPSVGARCNSGRRNSRQYAARAYRFEAAPSKKTGRCWHTGRLLHTSEAGVTALLARGQCRLAWAPGERTTYSSAATAQPSEYALSDCL